MGFGVGFIKISTSEVFCIFSRLRLQTNYPRSLGKPSGIPSLRSVSSGFPCVRFGNLLTARSACLQIQITLLFHYYIFPMSFSVGLVGLPNVGKSTLFQALTKKQVAAENYPFCTIDPNVGVVAVPDERLAPLAAMSKSARILPTTIEFVDIAGLVKGAHKGEGLGNAFLSHIREVDAICHVMRHFSDPDVTHVDGHVDALADLDVIGVELIMADLKTVTQRRVGLGKKVKSGDKEAVLLAAALVRVQAALEAGKAAREVMFEEDERLLVAQLQLLTMKPVMHVVNADEGVAVADLPEALRALAPVVMCAKLEAELVGMPAVEVKEYLEASGITLTGLDQLAVAGYRVLDLITFLTTGVTETRAWTVRRGACAPEAAGVIHTDFIKGFIRAEVVFWRDLLAAGSWAGARDVGKLRTEGKDYVMQDGDVVDFKVGV